MVRFRRIGVTVGLSCLSLAACADSRSVAQSPSGSATQSRAAAAPHQPVQQAGGQQTAPRRPHQPQPLRQATQQPQPLAQAGAQQPQGKPASQPPHDAVQDAQTPRKVAEKRPEQKLSEHDRSDVFSPKSAPPISKQLANQPKEGKLSGFDFARDPLNSDHPEQDPQEIVKKESAARDQVMAAQRKYLESRYNFDVQFDRETTMSRGKPIPVGPTARLPENMTFEKLGQMSPKEIREKDLFPYGSLPHPLHTNGGQVFPQIQIDMFPRLERFDVQFDIPEAFIPEFPPAIFLQNRPELGDVSRGEVVSINNFRRLFKEIMTPAQLEGMRLLLTPLPQEEFNATDDRKTKEPSLGVACFDCHVNGHTTAQFHLSPDIRPEERRFRLDTVSLRGMFNQQIHGSKRSLRSVEDFTEFEQRTAYFNGDPIRAMKKGFQEIARSNVPHMAQAQNMFNFPPAPKLNLLGRLDPDLANESELRGEKIFFGKGQCSVCHPAPFYLDNQMHDLHLERFMDDEPGDGPIKSFTLRGIKDSPPYLHDGRCLTLEDTVEFFNLVLELKLDAQEKKDLVAFMKAL
ncbi:MAG: cytochrome B6 [Aureliella sp.]